MSTPRSPAFLLIDIPATKPLPLLENSSCKEEEDVERQSLLAHTPDLAVKQSWLKWTWDKALKPALLFGLAVATALPNGLFSLLAPTHAAPDHIVDPSWWHSLSVGKLIHSLANGVASLSINIIMNLLFFPLAAQHFYHNMKDFRHSPSRHLTTFMLGIGGAVGASAIAYGAFQLFPGTIGGEILAGFAAGVNFCVYVATRYVGASNVLKRIHHLFDEDIQTQKKMVNVIDHINKASFTQIDNSYQQIHQRIFAEHIPYTAVTEEEMQKLAQLLARELSQFAEDNPDLLDKASKFETLITGLLLFVDLTMALAIVGGPATLTFLQKAFEGMQKLGELSTGNNLIDLSLWIKRAIALIPGLASGAFYGNFGFDFRHLAIDLATTLYHHPSPKQIFFAALLLLGNVLSASSLQNVATGVVNNPNNIILLSNNRYGTSFIILNAIAGFVVNSSSSFKKAFLATDVTPENVSDLSHFANYLRKTNDHPLANHSGTAIRSFSLFAKNEILIDEAKKTGPVFAPL